MEENLTDEEVIQFNDAMTESLNNFFGNLMAMNNHCANIQNLVKSNDETMYSKWSSLKETMDISANTFNDNNKVVQDTLNTFELNVKSLHEEGVDTANLADNVFKEYIERINAL